MISVIITLILLLSSNQNEAGIVYFSTDNGKTWRNQSDGLPGDIFLSDLTSGNNFLGVATKRHGIFIFEFQSNTWTPTRMPIENDDVNAIHFHQNSIYAGTASNGVLRSGDRGATWVQHSDGLENKTVRKFMVIDNILYAGTNEGLYAFTESTRKWRVEYREDMLQVNGIAESDDAIYIGTNRGAFRKKKNTSGWHNVMNDRSLHNISADRKQVYALAYSELFVSADHGNSWKSLQRGMPAGMYTFHVIEKADHVFAAQWDGVYHQAPSGEWIHSDNGIPEKSPITELAIFEEIIVAASSQWIK